MLEGTGYLALVTCPSIFEMGVSMARTPEGKFQDALVKSLEDIFTDCLIQKNDANYRQGVPDLLILFRGKWALLEVKKSANEKPRPNQPYYVAWAQRNSYGAFVFPENRDQIVKELYEFFFDQNRRKDEISVQRSLEASG